MLQALNQLFEAGIRAQQSGQLQEAARLNQQVLAYDANNLGALANLGLLLGEVREYGPAEELLRKAMAIAPKYAPAYINLSLVLHDERKFDESIAVCEAGLKVAPGNRKLLNTLASGLTAAERYDEALALLQKMVAAHPKYGYGHYCIGVIHTKCGRHDEALKSYLRAAEIEPRDSVSLVAAGEAMLLSGRAADALVHLDRALRVNGYDVNALALKTMALAELGRKEEEAWLSDPGRLVHVHRLADIGYTADDVARLNRELSEFALTDPSLREDPPEYSTEKAWHSTTNVAHYRHPALDELKRFIDHGFRERKRRLAEEDPAHPMVRAAPDAYGMDLWAVKQVGGSKMLPHIHSGGWLSGVYYIDVPAIVEDPAANQAGWLKVGTPRADIKLTREPLTSVVKPEPGLMATFPSYFWHDTVPLPEANTEPRVVLAYDLLPAR